MNDLEGIAVLVVDDDQSVGMAIARWLSTRGATVATAQDEAGVQVAIGQREFDVAIVDVVLVGISGITLARELRDQHGIGIVIITGYGVAGIPPEFVALQKPPEFDKLIAAVRLVSGKAPAAALSSEKKPA